MIHRNSCTGALGLVGLLLCGSLLQSCDGSHGSQSAPRRRPSILLISIDTLRADHLGCYGYDPYAEPISPAIDALAAGGVRFTQCFATRGQTVPSLASMMVGQFPSMHGIRENAQSFRGGELTLAELLNPLGYDTRAYVAYIPAQVQGNPARGVDHFQLGITADEQQHKQQWLWDKAVTDGFCGWLDERPAGKAQPFFAWVHLYDVHRPYAPPAPYDRLFVGDYDGPLLVAEGAEAEAFNAVDTALCERTLAGEPLAPADHDYVVSLYDGGIRSSDEHVGAILSKLEEKGLADDTLVILTADHGEELGDRQVYYFHGNSIYDGTLRIPLLIRWPARIQAGQTTDALVQNVDLLPTILAVLGEPVPEGVEGLSFAHLLAAHWSKDGPAREHAFIEWQDLIVAVRSADRKYVYNPFGVHPKKPPYFGLDNQGFAIQCEELYDVIKDPGELQSRVLEETERARKLRQIAKEFRDRPERVRGWQSIDDEDILRKLRALGYVGPVPGREDAILGAEDCEED